MIRGIYTAASALRAATLQQGRLSHNLANLQTTGFKQALTTRQAYELQVLSDYGNNGRILANPVGELEQGLLVPEEVIDFRQGSLEISQRPLDLAIEGAGFFRVQTPDGERYTRDGSFHRDSNGQLVTQDGHFVLGIDNQPIVLPQGTPTITREGSVFVGEQFVAQISLTTFADSAALVRENNNLYRGDGAQQMDSNAVSIQQNYLEASNVDENAQVLEMMRILRLYQASQRALQVHDTALNDTLTVGEV